MLEPHHLRLFLFALAANARVEGMKAENQHRLNCGNSIAYGEEAFEVQATALETLAREL